MMSCPKCQHELEVGQWPWCPHEYVRSRRSQEFEPVVVHRDKAGNIRFPGRPDAPVPEGFEKVELQTTDQVRRFEKQMNEREKAEHEAHRERQDQAFRENQAKLRSELRAAMRHMSPFGRDLARTAMERNDNRSRPGFDPGFHLEVFHFDSSNREPYKDERTGWKKGRD